MLNAAGSTAPWAVIAAAGRIAAASDLLDGAAVALRALLPAIDWSSEAASFFHDRASELTTRIAAVRADADRVRAEILARSATAWTGLPG